MARGGTSYIPRPDADFSAWANHYGGAVGAFYAAQGLDPASLAPLTAALVTWNAAARAHVQARAAAEAARHAKDAARAALEREVRPVTRFVQSWPATTNADRARIGIALRPGPADRAASSDPARPAPTSRPLILVEPAGRGTHALRLVDEATPTRRARPRGVERAELFVALTPPRGPAPADPDAYRYLRSLSDGAAVLTFEPPQAGMQAHYLARWVTRRGALGPWSETSSATIAA